MFKTLSAAALSLTIALTTMGASATPARANNDDIAKFVFGALAIGIIAKGISDAREQDEREAAARRSAAENARRQAAAEQRRREAAEQRRREQERAERRARRQANHIPARCAREARIGRHGRVKTVYRRNCLRRNGVQLANANHCMRHGEIHGRNVNYFTRGCLRRNGYQF